MSTGISAYPPSVQAGIPRLGTLPRGWSRVRLGDLLRPVYRPIEIIDDQIYQLVTAKRSRGGIVARERLPGRDIKVKDQYEIRAGDFILSNRQISHGGVGLVPPELDGAIVSGEYTVLEPSGPIDLAYLSAFSHSIYFQQTCFHSSIGVHVEKLVFRLEDWLNWDIDLPPPEEQHRISDALAVWDRTIASFGTLVSAKQRQKAELARRLIHRMDLKRKRFGELFYMNPATPKPASGDVSFVAMEDVSENGTLLNHSRRSVESIGSGYTPFADGDVLVAKITPCFENGKGALVSGLHGGVGFGSTEFHVLRPVDPADAEYIRQHTSASAFRHNGARYMTGSAGQRRVPAEFIEDYPVPDLQPEERRRVAAILAHADREIAMLTGEADALRTQRRSLLQKLLSGDRRLRAGQSEQAA